MIEFLSTLVPNFFTIFLFGILFVTLLWFLFSLRKSEYILYFLMVWFPLESVVLKYTPLEYYSLVKYVPEVVLYGFFVASFFSYFKKTGKLIPKNPLGKWLFAFLAVALVSLLLNVYSVTIWALGIRQVLRFALVYFVILFLQYDKDVIKRLLLTGGAVMLFESVLAIVQYLSHGAMDRYLFSDDVISVGGNALVGGAEQFWEKGTRVFATLGRYDRLGSLLAVGIVALFPFCLKSGKEDRRFWYVFCVIGLALILTRSRASWIAAVIGIVTIGVGILHERKVQWALGIAGFLVMAYLGLFTLYGGGGVQVVDKPTQTLAERLLEAVSFRSWKESYEGYGRIFFIINTPRHVIVSSPFFGVGPGNFGGGVAASLLNTKVYDKLKLPFGIENQYGQIDNSWLSLWGEMGTLGLLVWIGFFVSLWNMAKFVYLKGTGDEKLLALGLLGIIPGIMAMGFFGPYFEFRSLMCYFWIISGVVALSWNNHKTKGNLLS